MPKSKRQTLVSLTKTNKKASRENKAELIEDVRTLAQNCRYIWVFSINHMRNHYLQEVRNAWKPERLFIGRNAVMRKALGSTEDEECRPGCHLIAEHIDGNVGLLFTNETPKTVTEYFESYQRPDYPRMNDISPEEVTLPEGPVYLGEDSPAPHSMEPQLRKLGLPTSLVKGVPTLQNPYTICKENEKLSADKAHLLKLVNKPLAIFQIVPMQCLDLDTGKLITF